ncbi:hypothetical protein SUZIE_119990 [Sciurus carolinensis]|uniref:Uncharacterized protein n=1 Tax=Sciurus carolinensis TaxID=30640 RepID=A0AA41SR87_SCICA|nr:hypothetical protein [Sciurus carolinensis]
MAATAAKREPRRRRCRQHSRRPEPTLGAVCEPRTPSMSRRSPAPVSPPPSRPGDSASADSGRAKSPVDSANYVARTTHPARLGALKSAQVLSVAINEVLKNPSETEFLPSFFAAAFP